MECKSCGAAWTPPPTLKKRLDICPFCGAEIEAEKPELDNMNAVLAYIAKSFGDEVLKSGPKLLSIFSDLAPQLKREKIMLRHFVECDGNIMLINAAKKDDGEAKARIESVIERMEDELMITHDAARNVCACFWAAVGGKESAINSEAHLSQPLDEAIQSRKESDCSEPMQETAKPESGSWIKKEEESWRRSEAAYRQWIQTQRASQQKMPLSGPSSLVDVLEQRRMQLAHEHWSKPPQPQAPKNSQLTFADMEDWKKSEAAHRRWLKSLENNR